MEVALLSKQKQALQLSPAAFQGLRLLTKSLPELRAAIADEMSRNPAFEDVDHPLERQLSDVAREERANEVPDYPEDDFTPGLNWDEEAVERRQAFFDNQVHEETLQEHLLSQLTLSDISREDHALAEVLVGELDDDGYFRGNVGEIASIFERRETQVVEILRKIGELEPVGCGARTVQECLLYQLDEIQEMPLRSVVRRMIEHHLEDIAEGRFAQIEKALGLDSAEVNAALKTLRSLDGRPGRHYPSVRERLEYVNPEIKAVFSEGCWVATMDVRSLPTFQFSKRFADILKDPLQTDETKAYVRERLAAAQSFREAIAHRQETVQAIADAIFNHQQKFFDAGFAKLVPLTELEVAREVGVHGTTVSRTVRDKYVSTPYGTIELRRFFATGVKTATGEVLSQQAVLNALKEIVASEDKASPLSDELLSEKLKAAGFPAARRTVAKYRDRLSIPTASARRR